MMTTTEKRATRSLALIFAFRMLGLFMIYPVFALYADHYTGATPFLVGLGFGIYGLTQACLQIPFGMLSDRIGRKTMITLGLILFALGSVIAALAHSIEGIIIGRAIQGSGAVGSVIIALVADLTKEENRTKSMAVIGMTIGLAFMAAMILGPMLSGANGLSGLFWLTAVMAIAGIAVLHISVPTPTKSVFHRESEPVPSQFKNMLKNRELLRLDAGIMILHMILSAGFFAVPVALVRYAGLSQQHQWYVYLPALVAAFFIMLPFIIIAEKKRKMKPVFLGAILTLAISQFLLFFLHTSAVMMGILILIFMTAFTLLEATLPSMISKIAPAGMKGTAMGIYSTSQFLGIFFGGVIGGYMFGHHDIVGVFFACGCFGLVWFAIAFGMQKPPHLATHLVNIAGIQTADINSLTEKLKAFAGVADVVVVAEEGVAYLKVDNAIVDKDALLEFAKG